MAATGRVTGPALLGVGPFGEHVVGVLTARLPRARIVREDGLADAFATANAVVIALWRPADAFCARADAMAHENGTPWLPIVLRHPHVLVGPLVRPGVGPCFDCYRRRLAQHDPDWANTARVHAAYDADPALGPRGFLPPHARAAAGIAASMLRRAGEPAGREPYGWAPGEVVALSTGDLSVTGHAVLPCHGCERCAAAFGRGVDRTAVLETALRTVSEAAHVRSR
ncbi:TOMM precursor leader peptide-binding protein [Thermostaphylospora chromogena]|uniref:Bacteriocin biosynthesis cyclodehydratase domain-containing protein n=1 Tax=Thermostaphylospora chromogena TaxID=35622 RepID=A0A1H1FUD9_9ACTN|nr:TOMM precursor leader peptide-binding protein [Thermostaphylospora chromogena]SDR04535.1 bacteriocin biosynthesis cyclodehydratase domain-containing protein [Thermostaphylospora chromogena]